MTSPGDKALSLLQSWSKESKDLRLQFSDSFGAVEVKLHGLVREVNPDRIAFTSSSLSPPCCEFSIPLEDVVSMSVLSFEEAVRETFGKTFEELSAKERGQVWAQGFDEVVVIIFLFDAKCWIARLPN